MAENFIQPVGYTEMYEWQTIPETPYGLFLQFNKKETDRVEPYHDKDAALLGISTISSFAISDDPSYWSKAYLTDKYGDMLLQKEKLAVGIKQYDQHNELSYISTQPWEHFINVNNPKYNDKEKYVKRSARTEWVKVNLTGKVIVRDNGECVVGNYCMPYTGTKAKMAGIAIPYEEGSKYKFYIMGRISEDTIMIVNKNMN